MEKKEHYKLYKDGKQWCCMALATVAVAAGLMVGGNTVKADTTINQPTTTQTTQPVKLASSLAAQEQAAQAKDNGNYGALDSAQVVNNGELQVSGWQATNQAANKPHRYVVAYDNTTGRELGRTQITGNQQVARPDVQQVHPAVINAGQSGYSATMNNLNWQGVKSVDDQIQIVSRYSSDSNGEGQKVDYWSQAINLDKENYGYLDNFSVSNNQLQVRGWNATNRALGHNNHYIILYDRTAGREIARHKVTAVARPDVAKVYPQVIDAKDAGFSTAFSLKNVDLTHELQIISRYSDRANGEGDYADYWFAAKKLGPANPSNQGYLDSFNISNGQLTVSGWHATDFSQVENNHYLILFDNTAGQQVASIKATTVARPDVARAYRNIQTANQSGFTGNFGHQLLMAGHSYSIISRYSTLNGGNGDNGQSQYTDFWSAPVVLNQAVYHIDSFTTNNGRINLTGWMVSDGSIGRANPWIILMNNGSEVTRVKAKLNTRVDVARVYPSVYNSVKSGFNVTFNVNPASLTGDLQFILRFTNSNDGNSNYSDQYTQIYPTNAGNFDNIKVTAKQITLSGWHASTQAANKPYEYLIVLDNNGHELYRQQITNKNLQRNDVQQAYPYIVGADKSGFNLTIPMQMRMLHKVVKLIDRLTDDPVGNGNYIDYVSGPVSVLSGVQTTGRKTTTYDANGNIIAVYNDADVIGQLPELPTGCEITAVTMMLRYAGCNVNKIQLANEMPRSSSDGDQGFVGNPFSYSGWWIFPTGIAPVINRHIGHSQNMTGASIQAIKDKLTQGHLIVVWMGNMNGFVNHALALTGYNANQLFYNNPWTGRKESMTYNWFYQHWSADREPKSAISY